MTPNPYPKHAVHDENHLDPPPEGAESLPAWVARVEERLKGVDRLYQTKFAALEHQITEIQIQVRSQQRWIQGTAIMVALEVLGLVVALATGWRP